MYLGALGQQCTPGERFRIIAPKGGRRISCPGGTSTESSGRLGTGQQYVWCYRPGQCAAPPQTTTTISPVITTSVPTAVSTAVSPQISPTLAQQQASPGAGVTAAPQSAGAPVSAQPSTGITGQDLERILQAQREARAAEDEARARTREIEMENLRREMASRERATQEIELARRADEARRADAERFAREEAERTAQESAGAIPPPPSMTYAPSGGGSLPMPMPQVVPSTLPDAFAPPGPTVDVTQAPAEAGTPWALILMAAAGVGVVVFAGGKKRKRVKK